MPIESNFEELFRCGECGAKQLVYFGDPNDLTQPDVDAVECCYCGAVEPIDPDGDDEPSYVRMGKPWNGKE